MNEPDRPGRDAARAGREGSSRWIGLAGYCAGSFGANVALWPISALLLYFLTETIGFGVGLATFIITAPKVWDIFVDPLIGAWAGRAAARTGDRGRMFLLAAGVMPSSAALVFLMPVGAPPWMAAVAVLLLIVKSSAFMVFLISHVGLADDMEQHGLARRDTVLALRVAGQALGTLAAGAAGPLIVSALGGGPFGYRVMVAMLATIATIGMVIVAWAARRFPLKHRDGVAGAQTSPSGSSLLDALRAAWRTPQALALIASNFLLYVAASVVATFLPYMNKLLLAAEESILSILFSSLLAAMLAGSAIAAVATRRFPRPVVLLAGSLLMTAAAALFYPGTAAGKIPLAAAVLLLWGLGLGVYALVIFSSIMDAGLGAAGAGLLLGLLISTGKIGDSLGGVVAGAMLSWAGYQSGVAVSAATIEALRWAYCAVPLACMALSALSLVPLLFRPKPAPQAGMAK